MRDFSADGALDDETRTYLERYTSRTKQSRNWNIQKLGVRPGSTVLSLGSGLGEELVDLAAHDPQVVIGVDHSESMSRAASIHGPMIVAAGEALPLRDQSINHVFCDRVLQHTWKPIEIVCEVERVLATEGTVVLVDSDRDSIRFAGMDQHSGVEAIRRALGATAADASAGRDAAYALMTRDFRECEVEVTGLGFTSLAMFAERFDLHGAVANATAIKVATDDDLASGLHALRDADARGTFLATLLGFSIFAIRA